MTMHVPNRFRVRFGPMRSDDSLGNNGAFFVPCRSFTAGKSDPPFKVIASDGLLVPEDDPALGGWEHVSVSLPHRCPSWSEMCAIKALFWDDEDTVIQYHPPRSQYVNNHPFCLHLWRPVWVPLPLPPSILVGVAG